MKIIITLFLALSMACAEAQIQQKTWRVNYTLQGSGHRIVVVADSQHEARRTVQHLLPGAVITNVSRATR